MHPKAIQAINQGHHNFNFPSFPLVSLLLYYLDDPPALEHGGSHLNSIPFVCPPLIKPALVWSQASPSGLAVGVST